MNISSAFCRAQAAHHRALASGSTLKNVRRVSERAAEAWSAEAEFALSRERRRAAVAPDERSGGPAGDDGLPQDCREPDDDEETDDELLRGMSENPDRDRADP